QPQIFKQVCRSLTSELLPGFRHSSFSVREPAVNVIRRQITTGGPAASAPENIVRITPNVQRRATRNPFKHEIRDHLRFFLSFGHAPVRAPMCAMSTQCLISQNGCTVMTPDEANQKQQRHQADYDPGS